MAAAMGGATTAVVATIMDGPEVAATTMAGVTIAIGDLTQSDEAASVGGLVIWAKRACRPLFIGAFETCRQTLKMSATRGRPEVSGARSRRRD